MAADIYKDKKVHQAHILQNFFSKLAFFGAKDQAGEDISPKCPDCGYILDRPHSMTCSRCGAAIPMAQGCSGCGKCRKG
jgi:hypothetical protein